VLPQAALDRSGPRIGRYRITGRIGRGGMGMVYRGLDEALEREVAIKTLVAEGSFDPESRRRFEVEAKAAARLAHPNIVTVHELGEDRGVLYIAMEMLPGADLDSLLKSGETLPLAEKLEVVAQVCRGLAYAHQHGIVHRDIKPSNVRLLDDGTVKIMDFGIAKLGASHHITKTGMMVGTVHYMSPEQVRGKPLDGRSDVFSTGVILYELLAGERPFRGEDVTEILYKIVNEEPASPDLSASAGLAPRLQEILARALAKDAAARYPGAAALGADLSTLLEEARRAQAPGEADAAEGLAAAKRALGEGHVEEAIARLRGLVAAHPAALEVRRTLRAALRSGGRQEAALAGAESYPELEATFQAAATRRAGAGDRATQAGGGTELMPTVVATPAATPRPASGSVPAASGNRAWLWAGGAVLVTAALAWAALWPRAPQPAGDTSPAAATTAGAAAAGVAAAGATAAGATAAAGSLPPQPAAGPATLPATHTVLVRTRPEGASVVLDGTPVAGATPLELAIDPAREHRVALSLGGHGAQEVRIRPDALPPAIDVTLEKLAPPGTVAIESAYALDVLWRGRVLARDATSPRVQLPGGRQQLTLQASAVFLKAELAVEVPPGGETTLAAPALGRLNVRATPDNCEVFLNDVFVDYPPIRDRPVAAGRHAVSFRWPDGARSEQAVEVKPAAPAFVVGRKE
jgi:serine/threonine-protein kinase